MSLSDSVFADLLQRAQRGDQDALGELLEHFRPDLMDRVEREVRKGPLHARFGASDIVQQTCLSAIRNFHEFQGDSADAFRAWLQHVNEHNLVDWIRDHRQTKKRSVERELSIRDELDNFAEFPESRESTPSQRLVRDERAAELAAALNQLPPDQREAVRLRHFEGCSLAEIATRLKRSEQAVAGLIKRGLSKLKQVL